MSRGRVRGALVLQHTKECLAKIGIEAEGRNGEHGQDAIFRLIAAILHLLNVGFKSGEGFFGWRGLRQMAKWSG